MIFIDGYPIDVAVSSERAREAEVTQWPVESGSDMTDHVRILPARVTVEGIVSDSPMTDVELLRTPGVVPSSEAYDRLDAIFNAKRAVEVKTERRTYAGMMMRSLTQPESVGNGASLRFRAEFLEVVIVTTERSSVKITLPKGKRKVKVGAKPTTPVDESVDTLGGVKNRLKDYAAGRRSALGDVGGQAPIGSLVPTL